MHSGRQLERHAFRPVEAAGRTGQAADLMISSSATVPAMPSAWAAPAPMAAHGPSV
jgi:hypothetical protein